MIDATANDDITAPAARPRFSGGNRSPIIAMIVTAASPPKTPARIARHEEQRVVRRQAAEERAQREPAVHRQEHRLAVEPVHHEAGDQTRDTRRE